VSLLATSGAALSGLVILVFLVVAVVGLGIYFVPTIIAFARKKSNKVAIFALNLFLGWSLVGWVVSLVWALSEDQRPTIVQQNFHPGTYVPGPIQSSIVDTSGES